MINVPQQDINDPAHRHDDHTRIALSGVETDGRFALLEMEVSRGGEPPMHVHTREDELLFVIDGDIELSVDGIRRRLGVGGSMFLPRGSEHGYALHSEYARLLLVTSPAGIEDFYRELEQVDREDGYIERLIVLAARYGVVITGSSLSDGLAADRTDAS